MFQKYLVKLYVKSCKKPLLRAFSELWDGHLILPTSKALRSLKAQFSYLPNFGPCNAIQLFQILYQIQPNEFF